MEELKLIIEAVSTLGLAGKEAFIWYIALDKGLSFLVWMVFFGLLAYLINKCFSAYKSDVQIETLRDRMGIAVGSGDVNGDEYNNMLRWIDARK